jgi:2-dehydropantoate 2-reductase
VHVAIIGAGALGCVYGVRLALRTPATVTFVVRAARVASTEAIVIERVKDVPGRREEIARPMRAAEVPADADVILLAVGTEDLEAIRPVLSTSSAPILVLTPMLPADYARMRAAFGERVLAAMPGIVSYVRHGEPAVVRYWVPPSPTRIDEPRAGADGTVVRALAALLEEAGLPTHLELGVHETNPATTVCMIPIGMSVGLAGGLEELAKDASLLALTSRACGEGVELARRIGRPEMGALLGPLFATPLAMRAAVLALRRLSPEALFYIDEHFGRKLRAQHRVMAHEMAKLARTKQTSHRALDELALRLDESNISYAKEA